MTNCLRLMGKEGRQAWAHLTIVGDDEDRDAHGGISQGWYAAHGIDEDAAIQLGRMWGVDRDDVLKGGPNLD